MPKLKSSRGAAKRFRVKGSGLIKRRRANRNHILTKKSAKRMRHLRGIAHVHSSDQVSVARLLHGS